MSRTNRYHAWFHDGTFEDICKMQGLNDKHSIGRFKAHIMSSRFSWDMRKAYRKMVVATRRARDAQELHRACTLVDYDAQFLDWNRKDYEIWFYI